MKFFFWVSFNSIKSNTTPNSGYSNFKILFPS